MKTACPHCTQHISIDPETHAELQGQEHFQCPACSGLVPVPPLRETIPVAPVKSGSETSLTPPAPPPAPTTPAMSRRGLNRNLLILGSAALLVLGGLGFFLASRQKGDATTNISNVNNEIINNTYFQNLLASGKTTEKDLQSLALIRPYEGGFIGISKEMLPWSQANELAVKTGAGILDLGNVDSPEGMQLTRWLRETFAENLAAPVWSQSGGQATILDGNEVLEVTGTDRPRRVLVQWLGGSRPATRSLTIKTFIDGSSVINVCGDKIWYEHQNFYLPGKWGGMDEPTMVNGTSWKPVWNDRISAPYAGIKPAFTPNSPESLQVIKQMGRGPVLVIQPPSLENGMTLRFIVDDNGFNGPEWYEILVTWQ